MLNLFIPNDTLSILFLAISLSGALLLFGSVISLSFSFKKKTSTEIPSYFPITSWIAVALIVVGSGYAVINSAHPTNALLQPMPGYTLYMVNLQLGLTWLYVIGLLLIALLVTIRPIVQIITKTTITNRAFKAMFILSIIFMVIGGIDANINQISSSIGYFGYF